MLLAHSRSAATAIASSGGSPPRVTAPAPSPSSKSDALIYVIWSLADIAISNGRISALINCSFAGAESAIAIVSDCQHTDLFSYGSTLVARGQIMPTPYDIDLDRNAANFQPLTPLSFLERAAEVYPDADRDHPRRALLELSAVLCARAATGVGAGAPRHQARRHRLGDARQHAGDARSALRRADDRRRAQRAQHPARRRHHRLHPRPRRRQGADHRPRVFQGRSRRRWRAPR